MYNIIYYDTEKTECLVGVNQIFFKPDRRELFFWVDDIYGNRILYGYRVNYLINFDNVARQGMCIDLRGHECFYKRQADKLTQTLSSVI